jgi:hypothetical protein
MGRMNHVNAPFEYYANVVSRENRVPDFQISDLFIVRPIETARPGCHC